MKLYAVVTVVLLALLGFAQNTSRTDSGRESRGRYQIVLSSDGISGFLLDTETGKSWRMVSDGTKDAPDFIWYYQPRVDSVDDYMRLLQSRYDEQQKLPKLPTGAK